MGDVKERPIIFSAPMVRDLAAGDAHHSLAASYAVRDAVISLMDAAHMPRPVRERAEVRLIAALMTWVRT